MTRKEFTTQEVTLTQVLQARDRRVSLQQELLKAFHCPLICFTMNIAGPIKTSPLILRGFQAGLASLDKKLPRDKILARRTFQEITGCEAFYAVNADAAQLKQLCTAIEEATPLGRLFDMDVLDTDGKKLERSSLRGCIVCGKPGRGCAAGRLHPVAQLQEVTRQILRDHFAAADRVHIGTLAYEGLLAEVNTTPKPGLVDRRNCGSHRDMDIHTFTASAAALKPYFAQCLQIGQETADAPPEDCFFRLRQAGLEAEQAMYQATGGVNTHKGAVYTMGLLCGCIGRLWTPETPFSGITPTLAQCAQIGQAALGDFTAMTGNTAGERLYLQMGLTGIRGEAAAGFPAVANIALPIYTEALLQGRSSNDAAAVTLLHLIAQVEDTNLYHRGGSPGAAYAKEAARTLLQKSSWPTTQQLEELDDAFIARNLSPGGCADLLAVTCFLHKLSVDPLLQ